MPEHLKGVQIAEELARAVAHMEGHVLFDVEIPAHAARIAHPLRMGRDLLRRDDNAALGMRLAAEAVPRRDLIGQHRGHTHVLPGKEAVQLGLFPAPGAHVHHQIGGPLPTLLCLRAVPDDHRLILGQSRVAGKEFNIKGFALSGHYVFRREGMPPPVIAALGKRPFQHPGVPGQITFVCHIAILLFFGGVFADS